MTGAKYRMRRSRERRNRGALCVMLEIGWEDLDALGALGLLDTDETDPVKISRAARTYLDQSLSTPSRISVRWRLEVLHVMLFSIT